MHKTVLHHFRLLWLLPALLMASNTQAMTDLQGKPVELKDFVGKGRWTVFEIWASDCHICPDGILYMKELESLYPQAELLGISIDGDLGNTKGLQAAKRFIHEQNISFPTLFSNSLEMDNLLHVEASESLYGTPQVLIFNPQGKLLGVEAGAIIAQDVVDFIKREQIASDN